MSIFKSNSLSDSAEFSNKNFASEDHSYDYIIDSVHENNITSAFVDNTASSITRDIESSTDTTAPRRYIYGTIRTAGNIVWRHVASNNSYNYYFAILWCDGVIDQVSEIYLDSNLATSVSPNPYADRFAAQHFLGSGGTFYSTGAFSNMPSYWDAQHSFAGIAYSIINLFYNRNLFPNGFPTVSGKIRGRKIYDPRKDSTSGSILYDSSLGVSSHRANVPNTWEYSDNAALCLLDYMRDNKLGLGEDLDNFDEQSLRDAIDECDELVTDSNGVARKRYTCNGSLYSNKTHRENIRELLTSMNGKLHYASGKYHIAPYAYKTPHSDIISENDILGDIKFASKLSRAETYNRVKGKFLSQHDNYMPSEYPAQISSQNASGQTYDMQDRQTLYLTYDLPYTTHVEDAQRLARLMLLRSRMQATVSFEVGIIGLRYKIGDVFEFSNELLSYSNGTEKEFEITEYKIKNSIENGITVEITGKEVAEPIYDWTASDSIDYTANDSLSTWNGFIPQVQNLSAEIEQYVPLLSGFEYQEKLEVEFDYVITDQVKHFVIEFSNAITGDIIKTSTVTDTYSVFDKFTDVNTPFRVSVTAVSTNNKSLAPVLYHTPMVFEYTFHNARTIYDEVNQASAVNSPPDEFAWLIRGGRPPVYGDRYVKYFRGEDGFIEVSKRYYYQEELERIRFDMVTIGDPNNLIGRGAYNAHMVMDYALNYESFKDENVTWTYDITDYEANSFNNTITSPTQLTATATRDNTEYNVYCEHNPFGFDQSSGQLSYEAYNITVTATWATGSVSRTQKVGLVNDYGN